MSLSAALGIGWIIALSWWNQAAGWSMHRSNLFHEAQLRVVDPALAAALPPSEPPLVVASIAAAVDAALPLIAVMLLGVALVAAGYRWWGLGATLVLNFANAAEYAPLGGQVFLSSDVASQAPLSSWWPWNEFAFRVAFTALPAVLGILLTMSGARSAGRVATGPALRRSGIAAAIFVFMEALLRPSGLTSGYGPAVVHAVMTVFVIVAVGLVAVRSSSRTLRAWGLVLLVFAGSRVLIRDQILGHLYGGGWSAYDVFSVVVSLLPVAAGPLAVFVAPWVGRQWLRVFRSNALERPSVA
ncbi:MAG: hypothetical protein ACRYF3_17135 [Janthinobacterium lividum]